MRGGTDRAQFAEALGAAPIGDHYRRTVLAAIRVLVDRDWLDTAALVGGLLVAVGTLLGVMASLYFSRSALQEVQRDRALRVAPYVFLEEGGWQNSVHFVKAGRSVPGKNPKWVEGFLTDVPRDAESIMIKDFRVGYGQARNYGGGPALDCSVEWIPTELTIGADRFTVDAGKRREPRYSPSVNTMPVIPRNLASGSSGALNRLPCFIEKDWERKILETRGELRICCRDTTGTRYVFRQEFYLKTGYGEGSPFVHVTFGDVLGEHE